MKKLTTEEWIQKARAVHGDKYDYSKVDYKDSKTKVCIICSEHGEFWQRPGDHINKKCECPKCGNINRGKNQKLTTQEFIEKARKIHGDKYDYSKVEYNRAHEKVCILSGGYDIYIKYFAQYFGIEDAISSKIAFQDGVCLGKMDGKDCMRENKVEYIRPYLESEYTICYTDSQSDLPLLQLVDEPVVVSHDSSQHWAENHKYKQIIWN